MKSKSWSTKNTTTIFQCQRNTKCAVIVLYARSEDMSFLRGSVWCKSFSKIADKNKEVTELEPLLGAYQEFGPNWVYLAFQTNFWTQVNFEEDHSRV